MTLIAVAILAAAATQWAVLVTLGLRSAHRRLDQTEKALTQLETRRNIPDRQPMITKDHMHASRPEHVRHGYARAATP